MRVRRLQGSRGRFDVAVSFRPDEPLRTTPEVAARALELLPGLARHSCENDTGKTFPEELADTEVAHLFEHVTLELMAEAGSPRTLRGETTWDFERDGRGTFHVSLECDDERRCRHAVKAATAVVRAAIEGGKPPDMPLTSARSRC
jgi:hypothetical protein